MGLGIYIKGEVQKSLLSFRKKAVEAFAVSPDGTIYVTTSQIHIKNPSEPYRIFRFEEIR